MIPKVIHYCWFGRGPKSELAKRCIDSWKKILPDYELKEWNEDNFDVDSVPYVKEAYAHRKWAFVTDYVRLYALANEGGIYMDSDVEVLKPLDRFLSHVAFTGYESSGWAVTGIMGSEKGGVWVTEQLAHYDGLHFIREDGTMDMTINIEPITKIMRRRGMRLDQKFEEAENYIALYPADYFCPKNWTTNHVHLTENTYVIHHFAGTWLTMQTRVLRWFANRGHPKVGYYVGYFFRSPWTVLLDLLDFVRIKVLRLNVKPLLVNG